MVMYVWREKRNDNHMSASAEVPKFKSKCGYSEAACHLTSLQWSIMNLRKLEGLSRTACIVN